MLKLPDQSVISLARQVTRICLEEIATAGQLYTVVQRPDDFVGELATGMLADCLQVRQLKLEMIERWTMEMVAQLHHVHHRCACGHVLRSERECAELRCMECRLTLLKSPCGVA